MHLAGHKPTQQVRLFSTHDDQRIEDYRAVYLSKAIEAHGGVASDYSLFYFDSHGTVANRIMAGDAWEATWTNGEIAGISFAPEDTKRTLFAGANKATIIANGSDSATIRLEIRTADGLSVDPLNITRLLTISSPAGIVKRSCVFVNGVCQFPFITTVMGQWKFPSDKSSVENVRISQFATVDALVPF